jgi:hypothetical protein
MIAGHGRPGGPRLGEDVPVGELLSGTLAAPPGRSGVGGAPG